MADNPEPIPASADTDQQLPPASPTEGQEAPTAPAAAEPAAAAPVENAETVPKPEPPKEEVKVQAIVPKEAEKKKRRQSMFQEAEDVKTLLTAPQAGGDLTATLQSLFSYDSHSAENIVQKPLRRPKLIYENTYRLESAKPFSSTRTATLINATLMEMLENVKYNSKTCQTTCAQVAEKIRSRLLTYRFERYRLIVLVTIGSKTRQGIHMGFRNLWDPNRDSYASGLFKNTSIFASACVYAIYLE